MDLQFGKQDPDPRPVSYIFQTAFTQPDPRVIQAWQLIDVRVDASGAGNKRTARRQWPSTRRWMNRGRRFCPAYFGNGLY